MTDSIHDNAGEATATPSAIDFLAPNLFWNFRICGRLEHLIGKLIGP
jgi:hypothetical protein